jgi:hypothetical protein
MPRLLLIFIGLAAALSFILFIFGYIGQKNLPKTDSGVSIPISTPIASSQGAFFSVTSSPSPTPTPTPTPSPIDSPTPTPSLTATPTVTPTPTPTPSP